MHNIGIWERIDSQFLVDKVRYQISEGRSLEGVGSFLCDECRSPHHNEFTLGGLGRDNMTIVIIALLNGRTKQEWHDWVADRVKRRYGYPTRIPKNCFGYMIYTC